MPSTVITHSRTRPLSVESLLTTFIVGGGHGPVCSVPGLRGGPSIGIVTSTEHVTVLVVTVAPTGVHRELPPGTGGRTTHSVPHTTPTVTYTPGAGEVPKSTPATIVAVVSVSGAPSAVTALYPDAVNSSDTLAIDVKGVSIPSFPGHAGARVVTFHVTRPPSVAEGALPVVEEIKNFKCDSFCGSTGVTSASASPVSPTSATGLGGVGVNVPPILGNLSAEVPSKVHGGLMRTGLPANSAGSVGSTVSPPLTTHVHLW